MAKIKCLLWRLKVKDTYTNSNMSNCSAYWNFLFTARIPRCPVRLSRLQLPVPPALHSQELYPAPWQCFAACQRAGRVIRSAVTQAVAGVSFPAWVFPPLRELPPHFRCEVSTGHFLTRPLGGPLFRVPFRTKKERVPLVPSLFWCERWDSNPHGETTRTSNVLVYHSNTLASAMVL